ncbi:hypothetical protein GDO81_022260 [Engystomops pustulosus]|uniref:Uncharacterized protein n=1 Tax=Engystomops pustulosus TaxID=76066 RepID=A0AAV6YXA7_ENGPU|nr:hypothetical protein GDO81_022260 [Engystomops pustulosus]
MSTQREEESGQSAPYLSTAVSPCRTVMLSVLRFKSTLRTGSPVGRRQRSLRSRRGNWFLSACNLQTMVTTSQPQGHQRGIRHFPKRSRNNLLPPLPKKKF